MINISTMIIPTADLTITKRIKYLITVAFLVFSFAQTQAQLITNTSQLEHISTTLAKQKILAKNRSEACFSVFNTTLDKDERQALEFLYAYMPLSDLADYDGWFFLRNARVALAARNEMPWGKSLPEDIFLHFVLPVRVNNENLDTFRMAVYDELKNRVIGKSMTDAALEVNHWCHEKVTYRPSDERTSSPLATMCTSFGRCGEESTFTVSAMRTVGIPARQVYTPRWAHCDDNHAWVEVWIDGVWHFLGACEPDAQLDRGWFAGPAKRAMLVHTRVYGWYSGSEPVISRQEKFAELNLIGNYAPVKQFTIKVIDDAEKAVDSAKVEYQLYNYAEFFTLAKTFTNAAGYTTMTTGLGDLLIWAGKGDWCGYKKITVESTDTLVIRISKNQFAGRTEEYDLVPPVERALEPITEAGRNENERRLRFEDSVRTLYMNTFMDTLSAKAFAVSAGLNSDSTANVLVKSFGNWKNIKSFLINTVPASHQRALQMLYCLSDKDIRDIPEKVLRDHFDNGFRFPPTETSNEPGFFMRYVVSGRISNEKLTDWRHTLQSYFDAAFIDQARKNVSKIVEFINKNITLDLISNAHSRAPLTPSGVLSLRVADARSRDVFFVAMCRSFGIPARLNPETASPQYYKEGTWHTVLFEAVENTVIPAGSVHFISSDNKTDPKYYQDFTIAKFSSGAFRTLSFDEFKPLSSFPDKNQVDAGLYMIVTGYRLPDGSVLNRNSFINVIPDVNTDIPVVIRTHASTEKPAGNIALNKYAVTGYTDNKRWKLNDLAEEKGLIIAFIEPDKEPSKHVMADLAQAGDGLEKWGGNIIFALTPDKTTASFVPAAFSGLPAQCKFVWDSDKSVLSAIGKSCRRDDAYDLPVVVLLDKNGNIYFYSHGYRIGIGEQLLKKISRM